MEVKKRITTVERRTLIIEKLDADDVADVFFQGMAQFGRDLGAWPCRGLR